MTYSLRHKKLLCKKPSKQISAYLVIKAKTQETKIKYNSAKEKVHISDFVQLLKKKTKIMFKIFRNIVLYVQVDEEKVQVNVRYT